MSRRLLFQISMVHLFVQALGVVPHVQADSTVIQGGSNFGGWARDEAHACAFDSRGNFFVAGSTSSPDFPASDRAFQTTPGGDLDAYVASFDPDGNLRFATYFGGSSEDRGLAIVVDAQDDIFIAGLTTSGDLEVTNDSSYAGLPADRASADGFVAKLSADGSRLLFATYQGGRSFDVANSLVLEGSGKVLVAGITESVDFPATPGALQETYGGGVNDRFVARLDPSADDLEEGSRTPRSLEGEGERDQLVRCPTTTSTASGLARSSSTRRVTW